MPPPPPNHPPTGKKVVLETSEIAFQAYFCQLEQHKYQDLIKDWSVWLFENVYIVSHQNRQILAQFSLDVPSFYQIVDF